MAKKYSAGLATAYGAARRGGYTGTYEDFCREQAGFAENAQQVAEDRAAVEALASQFENTTVPQAIAAVQQEAVTQVNNVNTAGAAQVQRVQDEGTTQIGRVQLAVAEQMDRAELAANNALTSERNSADSASAASDSEAAAAASETAAAQSAAQAQETVDGALSAINTAKEAALAAVDSAEDDAVQAVQTEGATQTARAKAQADAAAASATAAAGSATTASTKAGEAADSATAAAGSASDAESDKEAAEAAQAAAEAAAQSVSESAAQIAQNTEDIADLQTDKYKAYATDTVSGAIVSFSDGADDIPVKDLTVGIEPIQSGTGDPAPDHVRPISGWTGAEVTRAGKNLFGLGLVPSASSGLTVANIPDGYKLTATSANTYIWARFTLLDAGRFAGKTLTVKGKAAASNSQPTQLALYYRDASDAPVQYAIGAVTNGYAEATLTLPSDAAGSVAVVLYCATTQVPSVGDAVEWTELQLEIGSNATAYEPYQGDTCSITFPSAAGTVYGGTLDVTTGKLTVDRAMVDLGTLTWEDRYTGLTNKTILSHLPSMLPHRQQRIVLAENYQYFGVVGATSQLSDPDNLAVGLRTYYVASFSAYDNLIYAVLPISDSPAGKVVYPLATPIVYDLTPTEVRTLLAQNNIWADCGDSTVEYRADTKLYIDKKIAALAAAMN